MTVIVDFDARGNPQYQSAYGVGSTEAERQRAQELDSLLQKEMANLKSRLVKSRLLAGQPKGNVELYWEVGQVLREVFYNSGLIDPSERHLYWLNARLHVPTELQAKDRGPSRLHLEYCFRLAGFSKERALRMKWGEWVYLFDSPAINREARFDPWLDQRMQAAPGRFTREDIRLLAQAINGLLHNIETSDLGKEELLRCYEGAWSIKERLRSKFGALSDDALKQTLRSGLRNEHKQIGELIDGQVSPDAFAAAVVQDPAAS
jgi:hypothetical protein